MSEPMVLIRLVDDDREWISRALRAVLGEVNIPYQRKILQLCRRTRGYAGPMSTEQASEIADLLIDAANGPGEGRWHSALKKIAARFTDQQETAVQIGDRWVPATSLLPKPCPHCANPVSRINAGALEWFCANCDDDVLPEGEA